ncbi:hypothetical protein OJ997_16280 [Solirubrobacter phytolaccae]|uniref:Uncharacterized protein n=1 Tax=Solirubrobacter phytolaccae TaxID=1404360 RepID=A0A9X3SFW6_9ACTN|nr:hypothetical protein [Solirubrobacter phytolaccae]MDA0181862.1 hypothetical protein [Solirubrobacter phytolaccae]
MVESIRLRRLRWRLRGAWQWPTFAVATALGAVLVARLPFQGTGGDAVGAILLVAFINLLAVAVVAPFLGLALRRRRQDLPFIIARDYAGTALLVAIFAALLLGGIVHRSARLGQEADRTAVFLAVHDYVLREAPAFAAGLGTLDSRQLEDERYRACVYRSGERHPICFFVNTDQSPAGLVRDTERLPNRS